MSTRKPQIKTRAITLRTKGYSYNEICAKLKVSKSTCSIWLRDVKLDEAAVRRLVDRQDQGKVNAALSLRQYRKQRDDYIKQKVACSLKNFHFTPAVGKLMCAALYWAEGGKRQPALYFSNSDPNMVIVYLNLLRRYFTVEERKFRALLHLHEYHDVNKQKLFWSGVTLIPVEKISIYKKPNSRHNIRINYPGCISIRYHDVRLAKEIEFLYNAIIERSGGVV